MEVEVGAEEARRKARQGSAGQDETRRGEGGRQGEASPGEVRFR